MIVNTCQCFGGPAPQPPDGPSPGRCTLRGGFWATVPVDPRVARPERGANRVVVLACPYHYDILGTNQTSDTDACNHEVTPGVLCPLERFHMGFHQDAAGVSYPQHGARMF